MVEEHAMLEPPVLVLLPDSRGWMVHCTCGWESDPLETREAADLIGQEHVVRPLPAKAGFFVRRRRGTPSSST